MVHERHIAGEPFTSFSEPSGCYPMKHNPNLNSLTGILHPQNSKHGLIEGASSLDHVVVEMINRTVEGNSCPQIGMLEPCPSLDDGMVCKSSAVG
jgi:hypothetical protein